MSFDYDLIVIGTNPGGIAAAQRAANYGASVAIVKCDPVGSNCVIHGCIPETLTTYTTSLMQFFQNADEYDCASDSGQFHWSQSITIKEQHTNYLSRADREHLQKSKVKFLNSYAQFVDAHTLQINGDRVTANKILIAVGGTKVKPNLPDNQQVMTTGELSKISDRPDHVVIVGSNHVAVRAAGRINALGTKVTLITLESQILSGYDDDLRAAVQAALSKSVLWEEGCKL